MNNSEEKVFELVVTEAEYNDRESSQSLDAYISVRFAQYAGKLGHQGWKVYDAVTKWGKDVDDAFAGDDDVVLRYWCTRF